MVDLPARNAELEKILEQEDLVARVCRHIEQTQSRRMPEIIRVAYLNRCLRRDEELEDLVGERRRFADLHFDTSLGLLLLLDPSPDANWSHPCWVATVDEHHAVRAVESAFPPRESQDFRLVT
jgi:hypothetical protein